MERTHLTQEDEALRRATSTPTITPGVLRLRMQMRAALYNPDLPHQVKALETRADIWPGRLADVLAGRTPLDHRIPQRRLAHLLASIREAVNGL